MRNITKSQSVLIDFIRGISAQMVLLGHLIGFYFLDQQIFIQNFGVVVFFVLSGHLITISALRLKKDNVFNFKKFFIDRFSRIYAGLAPAILICIIIDLINSSISSTNTLLFDINHLSVQATIASMLNLGGLPNPINLGEITQPVGSMRPLWSVALEWWIYVFVGITFFVVKKAKKIAFIFIFISILSIIVQLLISNYNISFFIVSAWLISSALILVNKKLPFNKITFFTSLSVFVILIAKAEVVLFYEPINMLLFIIIYFSLLESGKKISINTYFAKFSSSLSKFSYSLYLLHYTLIVFLKPFLKMSDNSEIIIIFLICNISAYIFYYVFERQFIKIRNFLNTAL